VIEATQTQKGNQIRNDRLIGAAVESHLHRSLKSIKELDSRLLDEIEEFCESYNEMKGTKFKPLGRFGPKRAKAPPVEGTPGSKEEETTGLTRTGGSFRDRVAPTTPRPIPACRKIRVRRWTRWLRREDSNQDWAGWARCTAHGMNAVAERRSGCQRFSDTPLSTGALASSSN
jgi:hypothetical protein